MLKKSLAAAICICILNSTVFAGIINSANTGKINAIAQISMSKSIDNKARTGIVTEEQEAILEISGPNALIRSIKHILKNKPREYKNARTYLMQAESR